MHYVIIGNGVAGINAANQIRNFDEDAEITIISYESDHHFSRTALMYVHCGQLSKSCVEPYERDHYQTMNFNRVRDCVTKIDSVKKQIILENTDAVSYDKLLIASGSIPVMLDWAGKDLDGVGNFVTWQNLEWLQGKTKTAKKAVVVGGGLIGIESVEILLQAGIDVTFIVREDYYWPIALDESESTIIAEQMREHKVDLRLKTEFSEIIGKDNKVIGVKTGDGETIDCDLLLICIGVRPQTDWLNDSSVELDERGGILVDQFLHTNEKDIYAAGDCASVRWFNGMIRPEQLWYTSRDQGKIAAMNMVGVETKYLRSTFYNSAKFFDIEYTTAGLVNFNLPDELNWYQQEVGTPHTVRITYLPDQTVVGFNMLGRRWDHKILVGWINEKRKLDYVLKHLIDANYDEEFMPKFKVLQKQVG